MARCLFVKKGESLVKDMARRERFEYLIPQKMRSGIQLATVPDILSVHGGKGYKAAIDAIQKVIELSTDPKGQEAAVEEFRLVNLHLVLGVNIFLKFVLQIYLVHFSNNYKHCLLIN